MAYSWILLACIFVSFFNVISSQTACSATDKSYVQVSSSNASSTILSSQALFPPYTYYVPFTQLVTLTTTTDNICDPAGITTDISNKIVLIFEGIGNCSSHYKVYVAEQAGAIAVVLANNDISGEVVPIIDDDQVTTTIPMRSIPRADGISLRDDINSGQTLQIEFGCFNGDYASTICILDLKGDVWYLDGDYQRQAELTYNDHPVYKREGYSFFLSDVYIFLHDGNGDQDWYWTVTLDPGFEANASRRAFCAVGGLSDPSLCPLWNVTNILNPNNNYQQLNVSDGLCAVDGGYICISSKQSNLAGLGGTYRQFNSKTPNWFKELDNCNTRGGWLVFEEGYFYLYDIFNGWIIAQCQLNTTFDNSTWNTVKFLPNLCSDWETIVNGTLLRDDRLADDTFTISMDAQCTTSQCIDTAIADNICLTRTSLPSHSYLEGEYYKTNVTGPLKNTPEYTRNDKIYYLGDEVKVYIWWNGEANEDTPYPWWVISPSNLTNAIELNGSVPIYAFCEADTNNPLDCKTGWNFGYGQQFVYDGTFEMISGKCPTTTTSAPRVWPEYLCVGLINETLGSDSSYLPANYFVGGYAINRTGTMLGDYKPHWSKPYNDRWPWYGVYIYYDAFFGWWQIGGALHNDAGVHLYCFDGDSPLDCSWVDYYLTDMSNMYLYNCTADDVLTASPTTTPTTAPSTSPTSSPTHDCSAIDQSYVQVLSSSNISTTLTSSQALFPPYKYYVPFTELAMLDPSTDDVCDETGITTDLFNKIILIFEETGSCSSHYKVYVAEQNGAIAVLLANNDASGLVFPIVDDDQVTTSIPMRSIPRADGINLQNQINSGETVDIEFGCFDDSSHEDYPSVICILDSKGDVWYLDGDYQRQAELTYNDHPVYKKEAYSFLLSDLYVFLSDADGDQDWYWTITFDSEFKLNSSVRAFCSVGGISDPSLCPLWNVTNILNPNNNYPELNVTNGLCSVGGGYICISSKQSNLAGLDGTYRQFNSKTPYWFRELDNCDTRPGWLLFDEGYFYLYDTYNGWVIAQCQLNSSLDNSTWDTLKYYPNSCTDWETIVNGTLDPSVRLPDNTFTVSMDTICSVSQCVDTAIPDKLCLERNSVMHGFLEGEYYRTNITGPLKNTPEYTRVDPLYLNGEEITIYIWWSGEVDEDTLYPWWVISSANLTTAIALNGSVGRYAFCEAETNNPLDCKTGWNFYFGQGFYYDDTFRMTSGECTETTTLQPQTWPEYLCIGLYNESAGADGAVPAAYFSGGYAINRTGVDGKPYWSKPYNDLWPWYGIYIYYDAFFGRWLVGSSLNSAVLVCFEEENGFSPIDCDEWYDGYNIIQKNMYFYNCTDDDVLTASPTTSPTTGAPTTPAPTHDCSATDQSYVQYLSSSGLSTTLTSSQALFPPYKYYVPFTELVILDSLNDDICNEAGIATDISDKIVLIFEAIGNCSSHFKVYVAEQNGAIAVLLANNDASGLVVPIVVDDDEVATTIPMRSIPRADGVILEIAINLGETVEIEFGCFDDSTDESYPSAVCVLDLKGDVWYLDGDYQRQAELTYNDHPVYKREGYRFLIYDYYIFLNDGNGDQDWYWTVTNDPDFESNSSIRAFCSVGGISDPSLCPLWNVTNILNPNNNYPEFDVSDGLCAADGGYICISSKQSNLAGLGGTYRQFNSKTANWVREVDDCDTRTAWLLFDQGYFYLYDMYNFWIIAQCQLDSSFDNSTWETTKFLPNLCTDWETIENDTLVQDDRLPDDTFTIAMDTRCTGDQCITSAIADTLCLARTSLPVHSFLEGEYYKTDITGPLKNTPEYTRVDKIYYDGVEVKVYMFWFGEVDEDIPYPWWVISNVNLTTAIELNGSVPVYAFCEAETDNPLDCKTGWRFSYGEGLFHHDNTFEMISGECPTTTTSEPPEWPEYLCVGLINETAANDSLVVPINLYVGGYAINRTGTILSDGKPHWTKPYNDRWPIDTYIYYDGFYGWWQFGTALHVDFGVYLYCFDGQSPLDCDGWVDWILYDMNNMYLYECTADDILTASPTAIPTLEPTTEPTPSPGRQTIDAAAVNDNSSAFDTGYIILLVSAITGICIVVLWWFKCKRQKKGTYSLPKEPTSPDSAMGNGTMIEMDTAPFVDDDKETGKLAATGGMDMSPLNPNEGNETANLNDDIDDDDDEDVVPP